MTNELPDEYRAALFQLIVNSIEEYAVFVVALDGTISSWNPGVRKLMGFEEDEFVGRDASIIFVPEDRERHASRLEMEAAAEHGSALDRRWHLRRDGTRFWGDGLLIALRSGEQIIAFVKVMRDDTAGKLLQDKVSEANRLKDLFLAKLAHELRTPLAAILGWTHALRDMEPDTQTLETAINVIEQNALAQSRLIDDLYDIARISSGKLELRHVPVDLRALIESTVESLRPRAQRRGLELTLDLIDSPTIVIGDPERLRQIVNNLLVNALKFTPSEGRVRVALTRARQCAHVEITDTGRGIDAETLSTMFEPYVQGGESHDRAERGMGLGLSIVRELVDRHGGTIRARSEGLGRGATFEVEIPLVGKYDG